MTVDPARVACYVLGCSGFVHPGMGKVAFLFGGEHGLPGYLSSKIYFCFPQPHFSHHQLLLNGPG